MAKKKIVKSNDVNLIGATRIPPQAKDLSLTYDQMTFFEDGGVTVRRRIRFDPISMARDTNGELTSIDLSKKEDQDWAFGFSCMNPFGGRQNYNVFVRYDDEVHNGVIESMHMEPGDKDHEWWAVARIIPKKDEVPKPDEASCTGS